MSAPWQSLAITDVVSILSQVIKKLDPKQQPHVVPLEIQALKNQLQEKDKKISHLEVSFFSSIKRQGLQPRDR